MRSLRTQCGRWVAAHGTSGLSLGAGWLDSLRGVGAIGSFLRRCFALLSNLDVYFVWLLPLALALQRKGKGIDGNWPTFSYFLSWQNMCSPTASLFGDIFCVTFPFLSFFVLLFMATPLRALNPISKERKHRGTGESARCCPCILPPLQPPNKPKRLARVAERLRNV